MIEKRVKDYFKEEKKGSLIYLGCALLAVITGMLGIFYFETALWKGLSIPLLAISLIQMIVGSSIYMQTNKQMSKALYSFKHNPRQFVNQELLRMEKIAVQFNIYRNVEMLVFLLGFFFTLMGSVGNWGHFITGTGVGLLIQTSIMFCLDLVSEFRSSLYTHQLRKYKEQAHL